MTKKKWWIFTIICILLSVFLSFFLNVFVVNQYYKDEIYSDINKIPENYAGLVLGAGLDEYGEASWFLRDRVLTAVDLYKAGKIKKIIMSGDNRFHNYNEPEVMIKLAAEHGVPKKDLQADYAGRRTYDSCYRAKNIFSQEKITVISQHFHMSRSILICDKLGIETIGFIANKYSYPENYMSYLNLRELLAINLSLVDIYIRKPEVVGGEKIIIK